MMRRALRTAVFAAMLALLLGLPVARTGATYAAGGPTREGGSAEPHPASTPLRHLVVMVQQGHTFDNYFGTRRGVDGLPSGACTRLPRGGRCVPSYELGGSPHVALTDTARAQRQAVDGGRMDGFVRAQSVHGQHARAAMGHYTAGTLPVLTGLAERGAVFDHWFSGVPGGPVANDLFLAAGTAPRRADTVPPDGWQGTPLIFDRLQGAGVPWRVYVEGYQPAITLRTAGPGELRAGQVARVPVLATQRFLRSDLLKGHVAPLQRYYSDLVEGRLPAVSFVVTTEHTERPPRNPVTDQTVVRAVANALITSREWSDSAFLLTYGSSGGWYDHVPPPTVDGARLGLRVPTLLVSPFVRPGSVVHEQYDAAAVLRLIEQNWRLAPLTSRDRTARSLLPLFSFHLDRPRPALIDVRASRPPAVQPDSHVLYAGYLVALAAALGCIGWVVVRSGHRDAGRP